MMLVFNLALQEQLFKMEFVHHQLKAVPLEAISIQALIRAEAALSLAQLVH